MLEGERAIWNNQPADLDALLTSGQINVEMLLHNELTLLGYASSKNRWECASVLLKHKAKVDEMSPCMAYTPLFMAARDGANEAVRVLIQNGVNVNDSHSYDNRTALHAAAFHGRVKCVKTLIDAKANMNIIDATGDTPLSDAIAIEHQEVIKLLVDAGCKGYDYDGWTVQFVRQRSQTKQSVVAVIGIIRWRCKLGHDMGNLVGALVWGQRDNQAWEK